jgi:dihydroxyacetone kinase-like predicted kinase
MNPSVQEIVAAIEACPTQGVIVLPNNKNIILTARQAIELTSKEVKVVGTITIPQGITALLSFNPNADVEANHAAMEEGRDTVRTIEITRAVRTTSVEGISVREGQSIALIDDKLALAEKSAEAAAMAALTKLASEAELITVYYGKDVPVGRAEGFAEELRRLYPSCQIEIVYGGQPHYDYIISVE